MNTIIIRNLRQQISEAVEQALAKVSGAEGFKVTIEHTGYGEHIVDFKLSVVVPNEQGEIIDPKAEAFAFPAKSIGLEPGDYGKTFKFRTRSYKIVGITLSRPAYPVDALRQPDGKRFKFPVNAILAAFGRKLLPEPIRQRRHRYGWEGENG